MNELDKQRRDAITHFLPKELNAIGQKFAKQFKDIFDCEEHALTNLYKNAFNFIAQAIIEIEGSSSTERMLASVIVSVRRMGEDPDAAKTEN